MSDTPTQATGTTPTQPDLPTVTLDTPIQRGKVMIETVSLNRPTTMQLKGISLVELAQLNADALAKLLPRITVPPLLAHEVAGLGAPDMMAFGIKVADFLMSKSERMAVQEQLATLH